jgi:hypothetical protein
MRCPVTSTKQITEGLNGRTPTGQPQLSGRAAKGCPARRTGRGWLPASKEEEGRNGRNIVNSMLGSWREQEWNRPNLVVLKAQPEKSCPAEVKGGRGGAITGRAG